MQDAVPHATVVEQLPASPTAIVVAIFGASTGVATRATNLTLKFGARNSDMCFLPCEDSMRPNRNCGKTSMVMSVFAAACKRLNHRHFKRLEKKLC